MLPCISFCCDLSFASFKSRTFQLSFQKKFFLSSIDFLKIPSHLSYQLSQQFVSCCLVVSSKQFLCSLETLGVGLVQCRLKTPLSLTGFAGGKDGEGRPGRMGECAPGRAGGSEGTGQPVLRVCYGG